MPREKPLCQEEMGPVRKVRDPEQEKDKAVANKAEAPARTGVKVHERGRVRVGAKDRVKARAKAVEGDRAVNRSSETIC